MDNETYGAAPINSEKPFKMATSSPMLDSFNVRWVNPGKTVSGYGRLQQLPSYKTYACMYLFESGAKLDPRNKTGS